MQNEHSFNWTESLSFWHNLNVIFYFSEKELKAYTTYFLCFRKSFDVVLGRVFDHICNRDAVQNVMLNEDR